MTVKRKLSTGASKTMSKTWDSINWAQVNNNVYRLQMRIAKAYREGKTGRVKALQWLLTHSNNAKLLYFARSQSAVFDLPFSFQFDV